MRERLSVLASLGRLIVRERAWWMIPMIAALALVALLIVIASIGPLAPFVYPLF
jgi:hypothetical protein